MPQIELITPMKGDPSRSMWLFGENLKGALCELGVEVTQTQGLGLEGAGRLLQFMCRRGIYPLQLLATPPRAEVIHLIDQSYSNLIHVLPREKTCVTVHDLAFYHDRKNLGLFSKAVRGHLSSGLQKAKYLFTPSQFVKKELIELFSFKENQIEVIPNGLHFEFIERARSSLQPLTTKKQILHVGSCLPRKNLELILECLGSLIKNGRRDFNFLQVGGEFRESQKEMIQKMGLEEYVSQIPNVSLHELIGFYENSRLLFFPSLLEGFGWPILEALSCGLPVLASNQGSLPEVGGGFIQAFDPYTEKERFIQALEEALWGESVEESERQHGKFWASEFTWRRHAEKTLWAYRQIYSGRSLKDSNSAET